MRPTPQHRGATPARTSLLRLAVTLAALAVAYRPATAAAGEPDPAPAPASGHGYNPDVAAASPDAAHAMAGFRTPDGVKLSLYAAEPLMANPVAFAFDEKGRIYVVETFRLNHGVTDNRGHMGWLEADLASRTVADRVAMYRKFLGEKGAAGYAVDHDRLRVVEDRDGDGKADHAHVFADGFKDLAVGLAAGVLARHGDVYFTCIPDLWLLRDADGDGRADTRKALSSGYGVHVAFIGHDLHGLTFGPDGRLYFSIGDRGLNVPTPAGALKNPDHGAVLRCEPDGTGLEIYCNGLRNPQELAFDEFGNLFTVDNNSDSGDKARVVYLMEGGDSGWRIGYQYLERPVSRGPWNAEKLWYPHFEGQAAYINPPLANLTDGPSGLAYNPGSTLLPARYQRKFFVADFRGAGGNSGVRSFGLTPRGAGFDLADADQFLWGVLATDVDFGPDGSLYVSDWVEGWNVTGKGRIYKLTDASAPTAAAAARVKTLLADGFDGRPVAELAGLLPDADQRVRQEAQFALTRLGVAAAADALLGVTRGNDRLARLHALWALGRLGRLHPESAGRTLDPLVALLADPDGQVRAQAAKTLGDARYAAAAPALRKGLNDPDLYARSLAATALGKLGDAADVAPLAGVLRENADKDPYLRQGAVSGLAAIKDAAALTALAADPSPSVRLGAVVALRKLGAGGVADFLDDADPLVVTEAALAVSDAPVDSGTARLAGLAGRANLSGPALRRVVNASARVGGPAAAGRLARLSADPKASESLRVEAVQVLAAWPTGLALDRVTGLFRPTPAHPAAEAVDALTPVIAGLLRGPSSAVREAALRAAGPLPLAAAAGPARELLADTSLPADARVEALKALDRLADPGLDRDAAMAVNDAAPAVRVEGQRLLARLDPARALPVLASVLDGGSVRERQGAFATLGSMPDGPADEVLAGWLDRLQGGKLPPELELDLLDAARRRKAEGVAGRLKALDAARPTGDPLAAYREALAGGDAARGAKVFAEKAEVACLRCHKVKGIGGEVGPDLSGVGGRSDRPYLLESIVAPDKQIAKGFETLIVATSDGQVRSGVLREETGDALRLITAEAKPLTIPKSEVEDRKRGASAMPADIPAHLSKSEIRDLVEYLSTLK